MTEDTILSLNEKTPWADFLYEYNRHTALEKVQQNQRRDAMGDHRADIKIKFEMHGVTKEIDAWINWHCGVYGLPSIIQDFFEEAVEQSMDKWQRDVDKANLAEVARQKEIHDQREYERLKKKYEGESRE